MIQEKDIKTGHIYKISAKNEHTIFESDEPEFYEFRELVLARNSKRIAVAVLNCDHKIPKKDRLALLKLNLRQIYHGTNPLLMKYDEAIIVYNVEKDKRITAPVCPGFEPEIAFVKDYGRYA